MNVHPITSAEFRKNMKTFLDAAQTRDIYISRNWEVFKLVSVGNAFGELKEETRQKLLAQPKREKTELPSNLKPKMCPNGHAIPYPRENCLGKGCKYS